MYNVTSVDLAVFVFSAYFVILYVWGLIQAARAVEEEILHGIEPEYAPDPPDPEAVAAEAERVQALVADFRRRLDNLE